MQFSKKISKLTCVLINSLKNCVVEDGFKGSEKFLKFGEKISMTVFTVKKVTVCHHFFKRRAPPYIISKELTKYST